MGERISKEEAASKFVQMVRQVEGMGARAVSARHLFVDKFSSSDVDALADALSVGDNSTVVAEIFPLEEGDFATFVGEPENLDRILKSFQQKTGTTFLVVLPEDKK